MSDVLAARGIPRVRAGRPGTTPRVGLYFVVLAISAGFGDPGGILAVPLLFTLKDHLGLGPQAVAVFEAVTFLPVCFGFLFGFLRDRWRPFGLGDRGYFLLSGLMAIMAYLWLSATTVTYWNLLAMVFLAAVAFQLFDSAFDALTTLVAKRFQMTGRLSALLELADTLTGILAMLAGGWIASHLSPNTAFGAATAIAIPILLLAFWRPAAVFNGPQEPEDPVSSAAATFRLLRRRPLWLAVAMLALWNFSPGWATPLFYYLTDEVGIHAEAFGTYRAANLASMAIAAAVYAVLCRRVPLGRLLIWSIAFNVFAGALFLVIRGAIDAIGIATILGFLAGFANVGLFDLLRRSCPESVEGTSTAIGFSAFAIAGIGSDLAGSWLYAQGGFVTCLIIDAVLTAAMLPLLLCMPRAIVSGCDGAHA